MKYNKDCHICTCLLLGVFVFSWGGLFLLSLPFLFVWDSGFPWFTPCRPRVLSFLGFNEKKFLLAYQKKIKNHASYI